MFLGLKTDADKKLERAKRFGLSVPELEEEKKKLRAVRFGLGEGQTHVSQPAISVGNVNGSRGKQKCGAASKTSTGFWRESCGSYLGPLLETVVPVKAGACA